MYIGHTKDGKNYIDDEHSRLLKTHLLNVSRYAEKFLARKSLLYLTL